MQPTIRLNHNLLAVESDHIVHAMVELAAPEAPNHDRPARPRRRLWGRAAGAGDRSAVFCLYAEFGGHIGAAVRRELRRLGVERVGPEELDGLVIDACFALSECGASWNPAGGRCHGRGRLAGCAASPRTGSASTPTSSMTSNWKRAPKPRRSQRRATRPSSRCWHASPGTTSAAPWCSTAWSRWPADETGIVLEVRAQVASGDPSLALTVARRHNVTPEVVRQVTCRVRSRLAHLAATDERFAPLADAAMVA